VLVWDIEMCLFKVISSSIFFGVNLGELVYFKSKKNKIWNECGSSPFP